MQLNYSEGAEALSNMSAITSSRADDLEHEFQAKRRAKGKEPKEPKLPKVPPPPKPSAFDTAAARASVHTATQREIKKRIQDDNANDAELKEKVELVRKISEYQRRFGSLVTDRTHYTVKHTLEQLRGALYSCRADVSSRAAETQIRSIVLKAPALMEQATAFVNPLDWDLSGFGQLSSDPDFAEALETELSEAVIEVSLRA